MTDTEMVAHLREGQWLDDRAELTHYMSTGEYDDYCDRLNAWTKADQERRKSITYEVGNVRIHNGHVSIL